MTPILRKYGEEKTKRILWTKFISGFLLSFPDCGVSNTTTVALTQSKKMHTHGHRDFVTIQLRRAFTCYYTCCEGKKEVMEERYKGHKFNITNFKKGCVCNGDWGLWKI
jgi:hypothetical protein